MLAPGIERFAITKSFGIGIANFGFGITEDGVEDDPFFEDQIVQELELYTQVCSSSFRTSILIHCHFVIRKRC